jgi:hypothetical protein
MLVGLTSVFDTGPGVTLTPASHSLLGGVADSSELHLTGVTVTGKHDLCHCFGLRQDRQIAESVNVRIVRCDPNAHFILSSTIPDIAKMLIAYLKISKYVFFIYFIFVMSTLQEYIRYNALSLRW